MELRDYIEQGAKKAGSLTALGLMLGMSQPNMSHCKNGRTGLPLKAAVQLAEYIGADLKAVIAANELVTEKDEKKRAFWTPFVTAKAASIALAATVTFFATPYPAEACTHAASLNMTNETVCIMLNRQRRQHSKKSQLSRSIGRFLERLYESLFPIFPARIAQPQGI